MKTCLILAGLVFASDTDPVEKPSAATLAEIRKLQTERRDAWKKVLLLREQKFYAGRGTLDVYLEASRELLRAELDLATGPAQRLAARAVYLDTLKRLEASLKGSYEAGRCTEADYLQSKAVRLEAEAAWMKAGGKKPKAKP